MSVPAAVALVPYNSDYVARLAAWEPSQRIALLHRAVALNPFDYQSWIQLGLMSELQQQNISQAERDYLKAAEVNHMFLPKWTLMNFYFRRQNQGEFFRWAKEALAITPYSSDPVFAQMWLITQHPAVIAAAIPDRARILVQYAWFLSNNHQFPAIPPIVNRLVETAGNSDPHAWGRDDLVATIEDRLLAAADVQGALQVWTSMQRGGWLHEKIPSPAHPVTNGDFAVPLYLHGFDWQIDSAPGAAADDFPDEKALRITLSGDQPESCVLLRQYVPLDPGRRLPPAMVRIRWANRRSARPHLARPSGRNRITHRSFIGRYRGWGEHLGLSLASPCEPGSSYSRICPPTGNGSRPRLGFPSLGFSYGAIADLA